MNNGAILWRGKSPATGRPIVAVATGLKRLSNNPKTGPMVQVWILDPNLSPVKASQKSKDDSICGSCPLRRSLGGACYVSLFQAPFSVWRSLQTYPEVGAREGQALLAGRDVRLGAYGDPAMVPAEVWRLLLARARSWTAYTHQWGEPWAQGHRGIAMASCESEESARTARQNGWRTFRVRDKNAPLDSREIVCPASPEGGDRRTCATCGACDGTARGALRVSIAIVVHGPLVKRFGR